MNEQGIIWGINGPVVKVTGSKNFHMLEMVLVGDEGLIGEVIGVEQDAAIVQVYEITTGLKPGEKVICTGSPLSIQLGPGLIGNFFDGIERPLKSIEKESGAFISRGLKLDALDSERKWPLHFLVKKGATVRPGDLLAQTFETPLILHKIMVPPEVSGEVVEAAQDGAYKASDVIVRIKTSNGDIKDITMVQRWPVRRPRPYNERIPASYPLITGQRVIDTMFPIAKGGAAAIPGGFGTGKTMTQHQLAKWSDADIIVYIGCGERGNEMTEVLEDFPKLIDPKSGRPLMDRTVLIANTSNMPVAAREASIYTGITIAEYYRDMGYHVAIMADSTSRWAEALREISGRLEEMPAEEGFPAYLPSRLSEFYERAGYVKNINGTEGSVTVIGAVSPQGGDFSEPVTQNTKRFIRCFWGLDKQLAYARHYPAIHWITSYSEYTDDLREWYEKNIDPGFYDCRIKIMRLLQEESKLMEIVKLIGEDVLPDEQKLTLNIAKVIRLGFLQQNAYHPDDTFVGGVKQFKMMEVILHLNDQCEDLVSKNIPISEIIGCGIFDDIIKMKYEIKNDQLEKFNQVKKSIDEFHGKLVKKYK